MDRTWCRRRVLLGFLALGAVPASASGQVDPVLGIRIDTLLSDPEVERLLSSVSDDFVAHFLLLAPDLPSEDRDVLGEAVEQAFAPDSLRANVARFLATEASRDDIDRLVESYGSGPLGELREIATGYVPALSFEEFSADVVSLDRDRLQLMVALVEARRSSDLALTVDEVLRRVAHGLVIRLGGAPGEFVPMTDAQFEAAYRSRTVALGVETMYRLEPASDDLVQAAVDAHRAEGARRFSERYIEATISAIGSAGEALSALVASADPAPEPEVPETLDPADFPPCRVQVCGFLVHWDGPEPFGSNLAYGTPGDLEKLTYEFLVGAGYRLRRGAIEDGFTIQLRARSQAAYCEIVTGTNPRGCLAVGEVRVDFIGSHPGFDSRNRFTVRNRCRANAIMAARGIARLVAARIDYEFTTYPEDERREPRC